MQSDWKFSEIPYRRPDIDAFQQRYHMLCEKLSWAKNFQDVQGVIRERSELNQQTAAIETLLYARAYHDATNAYYQEEFQTVLPELAALDTETLSTAIANSPYAAEIDAAYGPQFRLLLQKDVRLRAKGKAEQVRLAELESAYQQKRATLRYMLRGEAVSGGKLFELYASPDRALRKDAFDAERQTYLAHTDEFASLLKELVQKRHALAQANGFSNYMEYAAIANVRLDYGHKELLAFCDAVREHIVPIYLRLQQEQRERLGLDVLYPYDAALLFPDGNAKPVTGEAALADAAKTMYHGLSPEAGAFFDEMVRHEMLDVAGSDNKISGMGFCTLLPCEWKMPFVFANSSGTASDVSVYTHELGHGLQGYLSMRAQTLDDYFGGGPDLCEVHSKTMELFSYEYAPLFFGEQSERFLLEHRYQAVKEICAFSASYVFESWLYSHIDASISEWAEAHDRISKSFGRAQNNASWREDTLAGSALFSDMAIYMFPFYVISYALSAMAAQQLKAAYDKDPRDGWARYHALCATGGSLSYKEAMLSAGLRLPYLPETVAEVAAQFRRQLFSE